VKALHGEKHTSFFIPHDNWTGYWWQGENSRISSLAAAAWKLSALTGDTGLRGELNEYAWKQMNWILGLNPFDICMLNGKGSNNVEHERSWKNLDGGIVNGVTGGFEDERDIAFLPEVPGEDPEHMWRWNEQWLIHSGWFMEAVCQCFKGKYND
jgi:hypothetical protein